MVGLCCPQVGEKGEGLVIQLYSQICTQDTLIKKSKYELSASVNFPFFKVFGFFATYFLEKYKYLKMRAKITLIKLRGRARGNKRQT